MKIDEQWTSIMSNWYENQQTFFNSVVDNMEALAKSNDVGGAEVQNQVIDYYKKISENLFKGFDMDSLSLPLDSFDKSVEGNPVAETLLASVKQLWESSEGISKMFAAGETGLDSQYQQTLEHLLDPTIWLKNAGGDLDMGVERLSEGPSFAGMWDVDKRILKAQQSWMESRVKNKDYHMVVLKAWYNAFEIFTGQLKELGEAGDDEISMRNIIDLWINTANKSLTDMHQTEEFLAAQRELIRSGMQYRLDERQVAQDLCEMLHIPTRVEIDELHKTVTELRREVRRLKKLAKQPEAETKTPAKAPGRKTTAASKARKPAVGRARKTTTKKTETK